MCYGRENELELEAAIELAKSHPDFFALVDFNTVRHMHVEVQPRYRADLVISAEKAKKKKTKNASVNS